MASQRPFDLVVAGSINADLVVRVDRRPTAGETVLGGELAVRPGGKGANQAVAASPLGARVGITRPAGLDGSGDLLLHSPGAAGVNTAGVERVGAPTGVALIVVDRAGEN